MRKIYGYWTKEKCIEEALKYDTKTEYQKKSESSYSKSLKNNWLDEICSHMTSKYGYWCTKERCHEEALKYNTKTEFTKNNNCCYIVSLKNNWLDEICSHMEKCNKPKNYWTKEKCREEALKYNTKTEFKIHSYSSYTTSLKNKWLDEICVHMIGRKRNGYWTKEKCREEALKYNSRKDFSNSKAYNTSTMNKWLDEICSHMETCNKPKNYWTKEKCKEEALKYNTKTEFINNNNSCYIISNNNKWLDEICTHMIFTGNRYKRCIYAYEFSDNNVYVGLTYSIEERNKQHITRGPVFKYIQKNNKYTLKQLTDYIDVEESKILEGVFVEKYKKEGWYILNKVKTGGVGGNNIKWTYEKCKEEALKYNNISDFRKYSNISYRKCLDKNWKELYNHIIYKKYKIKGYWTKEKCKEEALKYSKKKDFKKMCSSAHKSCVSNKWLDECCSHMGKSHKSKNYWTKEKCQEEALKYNTRKTFNIFSTYAYNKALINGWLDDICIHMNTKKYKIKGYWTREKCLEESLKYETKSEFRKNNISAYTISMRNKWM